MHEVWTRVTWLRLQSDSRHKFDEFRLDLDFYISDLWLRFRRFWLKKAWYFPVAVLSRRLSRTLVLPPSIYPYISTNRSFLWFLLTVLTLYKAPPHEKTLSETTICHIDEHGWSRPFWKCQNGKHVLPYFANPADIVANLQGINYLTFSFTLFFCNVMFNDSTRLRALFGHSFFSVSTFTLNKNIPFLSCLSTLSPDTARQHSTSFRQHTLSTCVHTC